MKLALLTVTVCLVVVSCFSSSWFRALRSTTQGNANNFVDNVIKNIREDPQFRNQFDPLYLDEIDNGNVIVKDGVVKGILNIYRSGDCSLDYLDEAETIEVDCEVQVNNVHFTGNYSAKAVFFWIHGHITASVDIVDIGTGFRIPSEGRPSLLRFKIKNLQNVIIHDITGLSFALNWLAKIIGNFVIDYFQDTIKRVIEDEVGKFITHTLETVDIPM